MADHRVDAHEAGAGRDFHLADNRAGPAEDVRELVLAAAGDGDLVHDAAGGADDMVFRHLAEPGDARAIELEIQIRVEAGQGADFHGGGTADAHVHRHRAQQEKAETIRQLDRFLLQQRENAAANVGGPGRNRVGLAEFADLRVIPERVAG